MNGNPSHEQWIFPGASTELLAQPTPSTRKPIARTNDLAPEEDVMAERLKAGRERVMAGASL